MNRKLREKLRNIAERLKKEYGAQEIILYGSYARGEATEDSDIDILVIAPTNERFFERRAKVLEIVRDLYKGLALSPVVLTPQEVEKRLEIGDQFIRDIIEDRVRL